MHLNALSGIRHSTLTLDGLKPWLIAGKELKNVYHQSIIVLIADFDSCSYVGELLYPTPITSDFSYITFLEAKQDPIAIEPHLHC